jgi:hypothetical protein
MSTLVNLIDSTAHRTGAKRLDWHVVNNVTQRAEIQELIGRTHVPARGRLIVHDDLAFSLHGFRYLNLDGLVQFLCLCEALSRSGLPPVVSLPSEADQQRILVESGFIRAARGVARLQGPRFVDWDFEEGLRFNLGRPFITRFITATGVSLLQDAIDQFFLSHTLLQTLGVDPSSEDGWTWAPAFTRAVSEVLKNVLEWSGVESGFIGVETIPSTLVRLVVADTGIGVERSLSDQRSPILGLDPLKFALLYRYYYGEKPGLFTVLQTAKRWGGEFIVRSGDSQIKMNFSAGPAADEKLMADVRAQAPGRVPFLPGLQIRVDFQIPANPRRRR